jgi:hypothetical protein
VTKTVLIVSLFTLASGAYASTISSYSISAGAQGGTTVCIGPSSGSGPGTASCHASGAPGTFYQDNMGDASATLTDNSLQLSVLGHHAGGGFASASITHDDLYSVPVNGPVFALESLTCVEFGPTPTAHFSLGSTNVSPPVETIFTGASQGSGECGRNEFAPMPPAFVVSLVAMNNIVELHTFIDGNISLSDDIDGSVFVQLTVTGFQDANGNPITATLLPEPGTLGTFGLALLVGVGTRRILSRS